MRREIEFSWRAIYSRLESRPDLKIPRWYGEMRTFVLWSWACVCKVLSHILFLKIVAAIWIGKWFRKSCFECFCVNGNCIIDGYAILLLTGYYFYFYIFFFEYKAKQEAIESFYSKKSIVFSRVFIFFFFFCIWFNNFFWDVEIVFGNAFSFNEWFSRLFLSFI